MNKNNFKYFVFVFCCVFISVVKVKAAIYWVNGSNVNIRKGPGTTNYKVIGKLDVGDNFELLEIKKTDDGSTACSSGLWYKFKFDGEDGFICSSYVGETLNDPYGRPWDTPKKTIVGGAKYISEGYINKGQDTTYFQKFNVNPSAWQYNSVYNHQYMTNIMAPYSEAWKTYESYNKNNLLNFPLTFSIPLYKNMPETTMLPGLTDTIGGLSAEELSNSEFEQKMIDSGFKSGDGYSEEVLESYKRKLRKIYQKYPNWNFEANFTGLEWQNAVIAERTVGLISASQKLCQDSSIVSGWCIPTIEATAYYLDPRNFLNEYRTYQFEKLSYSSHFNEEHLKTILKGSFMGYDKLNKINNYGLSILDNQSFSSIFLETSLPENANVNPVYLTSRIIQEVGINGSITVFGEATTYKNVDIFGIYNFYNIGAYDSESDAALAGLLWAAKGSIGRNILDLDPSLNLNILDGYIVGIDVGMTVNELKSSNSNSNIVIKNSDGVVESNNSKLTTGMIVEVIVEGNMFTYPIIIYGDVNGDGVISAADYVLVKNSILGISNLSTVSKKAADVNKSGSETASDYVLIKNHILGISKINQ